MSGMTPEREARFWSHVDRRADDDCWEWTARRNDDGYGQFKNPGGTDRAHRISYELLVGPITDGLQIDHLCRNRACVNPAHLEPVTCRTNLLRGEGLTAQNARRTHCPSGHEYTPENTYYRPGKRPVRVCRECDRKRKREQKRAYRLRQKAGAV